MGRKTTAAIHDHYSKVHAADGSFRRRCKYCVENYAASTSNDILSRHYNNIHADKQTVDDAAPPPAKRRITQTTLVSRVVSTDHVHEIIARTFARHSLSHRLLEQADVQQMFALFRDSHCLLPNRRQLVESQGALASKLRATVIQRLRQHAHTTPLSVAIDGWTNVRHHKVTNVVVLCNSQAFYWGSIVNRQNSNTAEWLKEPLLEVMTGISNLGVPIVALVADNEAVNKALHRQLQPTFPFLILVPCGAHVIQLCVVRTLELTGVKDVLETMAEIINGFSSNKDYRNRLISAQTAAGITEQLCILKPCTTRWSSHLFAAQRLLRLRLHIQIIMAQTDLFWTNLESLVAFLEPFQHCTDVAQADNSTLYSVHQQFERLLRGLRTTPPTSFLCVIQDVVRDIITRYWHKFMPISAVIMCAIFSFDETGQHQFSDEQSHAASVWFVAFAVDYLHHYNLSQHQHKDDIRAAVRQQYASFMGSGDPFTDIKQTAAEMRSRSRQGVAAPPPQSTHFSFWNPKSVWCLYLHGAPELATAAIALLGVAGSEAACERTFSAQSLVHTKQRNRLRDDHVEQEMFIRFNSDALESTKQQQQTEAQQIVSLTPDCEVPRDSAMYIQGMFAGVGEHKQAEGKEEREEDDAADEEAPAQNAPACCTHTASATSAHTA